MVLDVDTEKNIVYAYTYIHTERNSMVIVNLPITLNITLTA